MKNYRKQRILYIAFDFLAASSAWVLFYIFRKVYIEPQLFGYDIPIELGPRFWTGVFGLPVFWIILYFFTGFYKDVFRRSRLDDVMRTFLTALFGVVIVFFMLILDDTIATYKNYYSLFFTLFLLHFTLTLIPRMIITGRTVRNVHRRKISFRTIMIGSNENAVEVYSDLVEQKNPTGYQILGFISVHQKAHYQLSDIIRHLGSLDQMEEIIRRHGIEEVIIALEPSEHKEIGNIVSRLSLLDLRVSAIPSMTDILTGKVKSTTIFGTPLLEVSHDLMPPWQGNVKQLFDIFISLSTMILLLPFELFLIAGIKLSSKGPVIYKQKRIGRYGKPFTIYKFRSMKVNAEENGPELSSRNDERVTKFGQFMRKHRLDEIPNFINVLKGDMALVGPRPERQYFIDQIIAIAPHYVHLQKVKPGITSWGQVKYGYAENVEQMIKRLRYDILYIENMSLFVDLKILFYTVITILKGKGV
ncbi:MAG: sugar transferase [Bacteroidales bacterium]|nr:sugar transferase [Bacteroidales bacterium]MBN2698223.1 sugar transferase [Bacteroidales bacterium]